MCRVGGRAYLSSETSPKSTQPLLSEDSWGSEGNSCTGGRRLQGVCVPLGSLPRLPGCVTCVQLLVSLTRARIVDRVLFARSAVLVRRSLLARADAGQEKKTVGMYGTLSGCADASGMSLTVLWVSNPGNS